MSDCYWYGEWSVDEFPLDNELGIFLLCKARTSQRRVPSDGKLGIEA